MPRKKPPVEERRPPGRYLPGVLTSRQETFCKLMVEGIYSNAECARRAGFAKDTANQYAVKLLDGKSYPHVLERIQELREERERRFGVTTIGQLERFAKLSRGAEEAGQYSAAINAEKIRSALGGLTIDRRETINTLDQLSRDEITARLAALQQKYPHAFQMEAKIKDITPDDSGSGSELLEYIEKKSPQRSYDDED
jgi:phage terminase small subunit